MLKRINTALALAPVLALVMLMAGDPAQADAKPIQVMVLGTYHMGNPGRDLVNAEAEDVRTPHRQEELADVARRLARFEPTKIAVEAIPTNNAMVSEKYPLFTEEDLLTNPNERVQVGYRLARLMGHENVYEVDEQSDEIDYFPFGAVQQYARQNDREAKIDAMMTGIQTHMKAFEESQADKTIAELLADNNHPAEALESHEKYYYGLLDLSDGETQPGAELNAYWYMRNAKIFAKLAHIAKPGDRIVLLYGSGHNYWLRHFAQTVPGFELVEPNDYLLGE